MPRAANEPVYSVGSGVAYRVVAHALCPAVTFHRNCKERINPSVGECNRLRAKGATVTALSRRASWSHNRTVKAVEYTECTLSVFSRAIGACVLLKQLPGTSSFSSKNYVADS